MRFDVVVSSSLTTVNVDDLIQVVKIPLLYAGKQTYTHTYQRPTPAKRLAATGNKLLTRPTFAVDYIKS